MRSSLCMDGSKDFGQRKAWKHFQALDFFDTCIGGVLDSTA